MTGNYTRWYRTGSVAVTNNSIYVTGTDTDWNTAGLKPGDIFGVNETTQFEIDEIVDNTHLKLKTAYTGTTNSKSNYYIIRNFNASFGAQAAAQATALYADVKKYIDGKQEVLSGKSAYDCAVDTGYVGTKAQWVASLKGEKGNAGTNGKSAYELAVANGYTGTVTEWLESLKEREAVDVIDKRTEALAFTGSPAIQTLKNNLLVRGQNLGDHITDEQYQAIATGKFTDMYLGDYWTMHFDFTQETQDIIDEGWDFLASVQDRYDEGDLMFRIIDFDYYWNTAARAVANPIYITQHHLALFVSNYILENKKYNKGQTRLLSYLYDMNDVPYYNSAIRHVLQTKFLPKLQDIFGSHLMQYPAFLCNSYDENKNAVGWIQVLTQIEMFSNRTVLGENFGCDVPERNYDLQQAHFFRYNGRLDQLECTVFTRDTLKGNHVFYQQDYDSSVKFKIDSTVKTCDFNGFLIVIG